MQELLHLPTVAAATVTSSAGTSYNKNAMKSKPFTKPELATKFQQRFLTLSSRTTTLPIPPKPTKIPRLPAYPPPPSSREDQKHRHHPQEEVVESGDDFEQKALFLDSIGIDTLSLLEDHPSAIAAASAVTLSDLRSLADYLTSTFNFAAPDLRRIVNMCPELLSHRLSDVAPVFAFLLREAKVDGSDIRRVINRRPRLLVCPVDTQLRPTLYFLQGVVGIQDVSKCTDLLSASVEEKLIPKMEYFQKLGFTYRETVSMFRRFPALFCYSVKGNFEPKLNYFVVEMGRELREVREFPQYFSFSLEKRIKPRHQMCVESGVYFPLKVMLKTRENEFRRRLDVCCGSSMPLTSSPLWVYCVNSGNKDDDSVDDDGNITL